MTYSGAQVVIKLLEMQGVETVFGISGGAVLPLYDARNGSSVTHVLARHEQGAGFMAQGMARASFSLLRSYRFVFGMASQTTIARSVSSPPYPDWPRCRTRGNPSPCTLCFDAADCRSRFRRPSMTPATRPWTVPRSSPGRSTLPAGSTGRPCDRRFL